MTAVLQSIEETFSARASNIDSIFSSFRELHEIYATAMTTANVNPNTVTAFQRSAKSVARRQTQIANRLYTQGFVLMTGISEALMKDIFEDLVVRNFAVLGSAKNFEFSGEEIQRALRAASNTEVPLDVISVELGQRIIDKLYGSKNPNEKVNLQNITSMKAAFKDYFDIQIPSAEGLNAIHRAWQERHVLIHNDGKIDERFRQNVRLVNLLTDEDILGAEIVITKTKYKRMESDFMALFRDLDSLIRSKGLASKFVEL